MFSLFSSLSAEYFFRNGEDIAVLQKATEEMKFFYDLLSKKSNIENNVHYNLCKAMNYEFVHKGGIVFYAGDIPDRFYILLKGTHTSSYFLWQLIAYMQAKPMCCWENQLKKLKSSRKSINCWMKIHMKTRRRASSRYADTYYSSDFRWKRKHWSLFVNSSDFSNAQSKILPIKTIIDIGRQPAIFQLADRTLISGRSYRNF